MFQDVALNYNVRTSTSLLISFCSLVYRTKRGLFNSSEKTHPAPGGCVHTHTHLICQRTETELVLFVFVEARPHSLWYAAYSVCINVVCRSVLSQ